MRLMPELYEHLNPMPFEAAVQMEAELAEDCEPPDTPSQADTNANDKLTVRVATIAGLLKVKETFGARNDAST